MSINSTPARLRQAISLNDLPLVKRILKTNPTLLYNPVYNEKAETSLHLAARLGFESIVEHLIHLGHDDGSTATNGVINQQPQSRGISVDTEGQTPLHLAAANLHTLTVKVLCNHFPTTVNRKDRDGRTPLLLAAGAQARTIAPESTITIAKPISQATEDTSTISALLEYGADVRVQDNYGNTCLHNACAFGNLKAVRVLVYAGADPLCANFAGWNPEYYSLTVQAEVYYKNLVNEVNKRNANEKSTVERRGKVGGAVRLVLQEDEDEDDSDSTDSYTGRSRADSGRSRSTFESAMS